MTIRFQMAYFLFSFLPAFLKNCTRGVLVQYLGHFPRIPEANMNRLLFAAMIGLALTVGARADDKGKEIEIDGLKSKTPASWKAEETTIQNRVYQFLIPKAEGDTQDAQLMVFFFGAGSGGSVDANITRWKGMIVPADGVKPEDAFKTSEFKVGDVKVTMLEANGTYKFKKRPFDPNEEGELRPDYRLVGVIFESKNGPYFMRAVGPKKTMEANRKGFEEWLKNFK